MPAWHTSVRQDERNSAAVSSVLESRGYTRRSLHAFGFHPILRRAAFTRSFLLSLRIRRFHLPGTHAKDCLGAVLVAIQKAMSQSHRPLDSFTSRSSFGAELHAAETGDAAASDTRIRFQFDRTGRAIDGTFAAPHRSGWARNGFSVLRRTMIAASVCSSGRLPGMFALLFLPFSAAAVEKKAAVQNRELPQAFRPHIQSLRL